MRNILNENMLKNAVNEIRIKGLYSLYETRVSSFDYRSTYDLFISHSYRDKEIVIGLYYLFEKAGYKAYIDWIDDKGLDRENVTPSTAKIIKNRILRSKGLAYIATSNITYSKWCPWELGYSDGIRGKACILPIMNKLFKGQEYLGLYPYLEYENTGYYSVFWVVQEDDNDTNRQSRVLLNKWLES